jgi:hypothetical protein
MAQQDKVIRAEMQVVKLLVVVVVELRLQVQMQLVATIRVMVETVQHPQYQVP